MRLFPHPLASGAEGSRTLDLLHAMQALSQLSYGPKKLSLEATRTPK